MITDAINKIKDRFILQISSFGYKPYMKRGNQILIKIQQAPLSVHSSFVSPTKFASKNNQFNSGGMFCIKAKIISKVNIELNQLELIFLFKLSNFLFPVNSIRR